MCACVCVCLFVCLLVGSFVCLFVGLFVLIGAVDALQKQTKLYFSTKGRASANAREAGSNRDEAMQWLTS